MPRLNVSKMTSASGEYTHMVVFFAKVLYFFVYRKKSMILCSPSPGTQQSEKNIFKFFQSCSISFKILVFRFAHRSYKKVVPGEIEFCLKYSSSSTPTSSKTLSNSYSSHEDLNLRSLNVWDKCIPRLVYLSPRCHSIKRDEDHILWVNYWDEFLQVVIHTLVYLLQCQRFYLVTQKTIAFLLLF